MAGVTEFSKRVITVCAESDVVESWDVTVHEDVVVRIRVFLHEMFIDVYYNAVTEKRSYALISDEKRIYGADNLGGWHVHPFEAPDEHRDCDEVTFASFLKQVEAYV